MDTIINFHKDYKNWLSSLDFYKEEVNFFFKELNAVFDHDKKNLSRMEIIDEYEKILDGKISKIEDLISRISDAEKNILGGHITAMTNEHQKLACDFEDFEQSFTEMKNQFKRFASHND